MLLMEYHISLRHCKSELKKSSIREKIIKLANSTHKTACVVYSLLRAMTKIQASHPTPLCWSLICIPAVRSRFGHFATIWAMGFSASGLDYSSGRCNSSSSRQQPHSLSYGRPLSFCAYSIENI